VGDKCNIFQENYTGELSVAEMTFQGHSWSSEMAPFDRELRLPINVPQKPRPYLLPFPKIERDNGRKLQTLPTHLNMRPPFGVILLEFCYYRPIFSVGKLE